MSRQRAKATFERIRSSGGKPTGSFIFSSDPSTTAIFGAAGYDWLVIDREHGIMDDGVALAHIRAAEAADVIPIVRVLEGRPALIQKSMDMGAQGIMIPKIGSADEAARAVAASRYQPGGRGMCPIVPGADFTHLNWAEYSRSINENVLVIPLIETKAGLDNIDEIVKVPGIDYVFFGLADLSQDLGIDMIDGADELIGHWERVVECAHRQGVAAGAPLGYGFDDLADFGTLGGDFDLLAAAARSALSQRAK